MTEPHGVGRSIRAVAIYEIVKGIGAVLTTFAIWMWHKELITLVGSANNAWVKGFGSLFEPQLESLMRIAQQAAKNWRLFMVGTVGYAVVRFIEAYGLLNDKAWAYWISVLGYGLFIPLEFYYLIVRPFDWFKLFILTLNIVVVYVVFKKMRKKGLI